MTLLQFTASTGNLVAVPLGKIEAVEETGAGTHTPGLTVRLDDGTTHTVAGESYARLTARVAAAGCVFIV